MAEAPTIVNPKVEKNIHKTAQMVEHSAPVKQHDWNRRDGSVHHKWSHTMDGVRNVGGVYHMDFVPIVTIKKNANGRTVIEQSRVARTDASTLKTGRRKSATPNATVQQAPKTEIANTQTVSPVAPVVKTAAETKLSSEAKLAPLKKAPFSLGPLYSVMQQTFKLQENKKQDEQKAAASPSVNDTAKTDTTGTAPANVKTSNTNTTTAAVADKTTATTTTTKNEKGQTDTPAQTTATATKATEQNTGATTQTKGAGNTTASKSAALHNTRPPVAKATTATKPQGNISLASTTKKETVKVPVIKNLQGFIDSSPSIMAAGFGLLGGIVAADLNSKKQADIHSVPVLKSEMQGAKDITAPVAKDMVVKEAVVSDFSSYDPAPLQNTPHKHLGDVPDNADAEKEAAKDHGGIFSMLMDAFANVLGNIITEDPGVVTDIHEHYEVGDDGNLSATRTDAQNTEAEAQAENARTDAEHNVTQRKPGDTIKPLGVNEHHTVTPELPETEAIVTTASDGIADYAHVDLPDSVRNLADQKLKQKMAGGLAQVKGDADGAQAEHDAGKQQAITEANNANKQLNIDANKEQNEAVKLGRAEITSHQEEAKTEGDKILDEHKKAASTEHESAKKEISDRKNSDNAAANEQLRVGQAKAEEEKRKSNEQAAAEKKKADEKSKDKGWWDSFKDAVSSVVKAVTAAISKIFSALRKLVSDIIDAAKNAAIALIEAGRKAIVSRINKFRDALKTLVVNTIGKRYPELARRINAKIDKAANAAISTVNKVADKLKKGVTALADTLKKGFEWISKRLEAGLKGAVGVLGALATGDFKEALKIAFYTACEVAGVDAKQVEAFLAKAGNNLALIFKDVARFATTALKGVIGGFNLFGDKFMDNFTQGIVGWLTGNFPTIKIPKTFDIAGAFSLVTQVLGLTYGKIKDRVKEKLPENLRAVVDTIEQHAPELMTLITNLKEKGPIALWDFVKDKAGELYDQALGMIGGVITEQVITGAIKWAAGLAAFPLGTIIEGALTIWNLVKFIKEQYNRMVAFFQRIYDMVGDMVAGKVSFIINSVKDVLVKLLPLALELLASVLNIGGIAEKVGAKLKQLEEFIIRITEPVVSWIVSVAKRIFAGAGKLIDKVKNKVGGWLGLKKEFKTKDGHTHNLYFKGSESSYQLMVASDPITLASLIEKVTDGGKKGELVGLKRELDDFMHSHLSKQPKDAAETDTIKAGIQGRLDVIKDKLIEAKVLDKEALPLTKVTFQMKNGIAYKVEANPLTKLSGNTKGSPADSGSMKFPKGWEQIDALKENKWWDRTHLLSHVFHGPGNEAWNIVPGRKTLNAAFREGPEKWGKEQLAKDATLFYRIEVKENTNSKMNKTMNYFPLQIEVVYGFLDGNVEKMDPTSPALLKQEGPTEDIKNPGATNINSLSRGRLRDIFVSIDDTKTAIGDKIYYEMQKKSYDGIDDFTLRCEKLFTPAQVLAIENIIKVNNYNIIKI